MRAIVASSGLLSIGGETLRAAVGWGGIRPDKQEGDGATPAAVMKLRAVYYRPDRLQAPVCSVTSHALREQDGWCDAPAHPDYNRLVRLPIEASAESLWRADGVYDIIGVLGWNDAPVVPGRGSAIFLHVARPDYAPTEGCVALSRTDVLRVLQLGLTEIVALPEGGS